MGHDTEDRMLLRWLAVLAVVFAMIFTLNGLGFGLRYSHVLAGDKIKDAAAEREAKANKKGLGGVLGLESADTALETTPAPEPEKVAKGQSAPGRAKGDKGGGSVPETPATPDPPTAGRGDIASVVKVVPGQVKKGSSGGGVTEEPAGPTPSPDPFVTATTSLSGDGGDDDCVTPPTPSTEPEVVSGNPPLCEGGLKIESPCNGTHVYHHEVDGHSVTITIKVYDTPNGQAFNWTSSWPVTRVTAKGGSLGANVYSYDPPATSDGGLHSPPANDKNPHWAGLSHIDFCFGEKPPCEITKTFEVVYPDLPEGARLWVKYQVNDGEYKKVELQPSGADLYSFVDPHIPEGSLVKGEWLLTHGDEEEVLGHFKEVLCEDKTNHFEYKKQVCGAKYEDMNGNGARDPGELGLGGWEITLYRKAYLICDVGTWEPYATVKTNPDGTYCFGGLPPGLYKVAEEQRTGWKQTDAPDVCEFKIDACHPSISGLDFGNLELPDITVLKFNDKNGNGWQDNGEPAISGWTFTLKKGGASLGEKATGIEGTATWVDLELGTYVLDEAPSKDWRATTPLPRRRSREARRALPQATAPEAAPALPSPVRAPAL